MRVLVVEHDPGDARLIRERLAETAGLVTELTVVSGLEDALVRLQEEAHDAVLLDLGLPDAAGLKAVEEVTRAFPYLPTIVLTGSQDAHTALEALRVGAQDYLEKSLLDGPLLSRALRYAVERKRIQTADRFIAEAGRRLVSTLDLTATLRHLAQLLVEDLADYCIVDVADGQGTLARLEVAYRDPGASELAVALTRTVPPQPSDAARSTASAEAVLVAAGDADDVISLTRSAEEIAVFRRMGVRSYIRIPLHARDRFVGEILVISTHRSFDQNDLGIVGRLSWIAALAIDNARLYHEAREALRRRDRVLGVVAHDLRNPLSTIAMSAELLLEPRWPEEKRLQQLNIIRRSADRMDRLIEDLLDVARIESGKLVLHLQPLDPATVAGEAVELNTALAAARSLRIESESSGPPAVILADHARLLQVLANLIGNALKFTPAGGSIMVRTEPVAEGVRFSVRDTGPGIPPDDLPYLFEAFWQRRKGPAEGVGLGLAIARGIVEAHGGTIWPESEVGVGTTMFFAIPQARDRRRRNDGGSRPSGVGG